MNDHLYDTEKVSQTFKAMEKPLSEFPEITVVILDGDIQVSIPTDQVFVQGDWLSRRYSCTPFWKIQRWLNKHGYYFKTLSIP